MKVYHGLLEHVLNHGVLRSDRTGTGTKSVFGYQMRFNLREGFPLMTTKKVHTKSIIHELLWFVRGDTNVKSLQEVGVTIWDEWADKDGNLGPVYGAQWRRWRAFDEKNPDGKTIDQLSELIEGLKKNPHSRRHVISAWNVGEISKMALPPCHALFQFYVANGELSCQLYQRSADIFLGVPFNIASYALLTHMIAEIVGLKVGDFVLTLGDAHLYTNHFEQAKLQLTRQERPLPNLKILNVPKKIDDYRFEDFVIEGYDPHPAIKAPISV